MDNAVYYLLSRLTTETRLPRFPPLPLYCNNNYFTPLSERAFRAQLPIDAWVKSFELKHIAIVKNKITGLIYIMHVCSVSHEAQEIN